MTFAPKKIKELLRISRKGFYNSIDNDFILPLVDEFGYTNESLKEAQQLHQDVEFSVLDRENKQGLKIAVSIRMVNAIDRIYKRTALYSLHLKRDLRNAPDLVSEYKLNAIRPKSSTEKLEYAKAFYKRCKGIEGLAPRVAAYGLSPERVDTLLAEIFKIEEDEDYRTILKKDTETSTVARNKLAEKLNDIWYKYKATLIFVLKEDPQQLEAFGIVTYSEGYKPKKKDDTTTGEGENGTENTDEQNTGGTGDDTGGNTGTKCDGSGQQTGDVNTAHTANTAPEKMAALKIKDVKTQ